MKKLIFILLHLYAVGLMAQSGDTILSKVYRWNELETKKEKIG